MIFIDKPKDGTGYPIFFDKQKKLRLAAVILDGPTNINKSVSCEVAWQLEFIIQIALWDFDSKKKEIQVDFPPGGKANIRCGFLVSFDRFFCFQNGT